MPIPSSFIPNPEFVDYCPTPVEPLVEVNNEDEIRLELNFGVRLVGINNRNLHEFTVNMERDYHQIDCSRPREE
jgi:indole-3-glycerol phosphate synthase